MKLNLITDRTSADVSVAQSYQGRRWNDLSETQKKEYLAGLKGTYNYIDFNRVEEAVQFLSDLLNSYNYFNKVRTKTDWKPQDIQTVSEVQRYLDNIAELKNKYYSNTEGEMPTTSTWITVEGANYLEQLLVDMYEVVKGMEQSYIKNGVPNIGQSRLWQQRFRINKNWTSLPFAIGKYDQTWAEVSMASDEVGTFPLEDRESISVTINTINKQMQDIDEMIVYFDEITGGIVL